MATKIMRGEWVVEGATLEELQLGIEAVERALSGRLPRGQQSGESEPAAARPRRGRPRKPKDDAGTAEKLVHRRAIQFLLAINKGGADGVHTPALLKPLGAEHPKGIGNAISKINALLASLGYKPDEVFSSLRRPGEDKTWLPGKKIDEAIDKLTD